MKYSIRLLLILSLFSFASCDKVKNLLGLGTSPKKKVEVGAFSDNISHKSCENSQLAECINEQTEPESSDDCHDVIVDNNLSHVNASQIRIPVPKSGPGWTSSYSQWALDGSNQIIQNENLSDIDLEKLGCPGYRTATPEQRKLFWPYFLAALAKKESNYRSTTDYPECSNGTTWNPETQTASQAAHTKGARSCWISSGLFQLTRSTVENRPYSCSFKESGWRAVHDPEDNIKCALKVLNQQIKSCGLFCKTSKAYFGPLKRDGDSEKIQAHFRALALNHLPFCQRGASAGSPRVGQLELDSKCSRIRNSNANFLESEDSKQVSGSSATITQ